MTLFVFIYAYYQSVRILPFLVRAVQVDGLFLLQHSVRLQQDQAKKNKWRYRTSIYLLRFGACTLRGGLW